MIDDSTRQWYRTSAIALYLTRIGLPQLLANQFAIQAPDPAIRYILAMRHHRPPREIDWESVSKFSATVNQLAGKMVKLDNI